MFFNLMKLQFQKILQCMKISSIYAPIIFYELITSCYSNYVSEGSIAAATQNLRVRLMVMRAKVRIRGESYGLRLRSWLG